MVKKIHTLLQIMALLNLLTISEVSWAHNPGSSGERGVSRMPAIKNGPDINRAGYGWLNSSSEVAAETFFHDLCPQRGGGSFSPALCAQQQDLIDSGLGNNLAWPAIESSFMFMSQVKIYEHAAMEAAAMGKPIPDVPSCLASSQQARDIKTFVDANKNKNETTLATEIETLGTAIQNGTSATPDADKSKMQNLVKLRSVRGSFSSNRVAQALLLDKNLKKQQNDMCSKSDKNSKLACINIKGARDRIRIAFPVIFNGGTLTDNMFGDNSVLERFSENEDACGHVARQRLENSIYESMGAFRSPTNLHGLSASCNAYTASTLDDSESSSARANKLATSACKALETNDQRKMICRGAGLAKDGVTKRFGYDSLVNTSAKNPGLWNQTINALNFVVGGPAAGTAPSNPALTAEQTARLLSAGTRFNSAMDDMKAKYEKHIQYQLRTMCDPTQGGSSLGRIMTVDPVAVQQAVLDIPNPKAQQAVKLMMCQKPSKQQPYLERYQKYNQSFSCLGVTQNPDGSTRVKRESFGWPYTGDVLYDIKNDNGTKVINVPIKFNPACDHYLAGLHVPTAGPAPRGLSNANYTQLMNLSDSNGNGTIDADEFDYFQLAGMNCNAQKQFAMNKAVGPNGWITSANSRWTAQGGNIRPALTPPVRFNIQQCCSSGCAITCPSGTKEINISPCFNADSGSSACQNSSGNRENEQNYSFAQNNSTTWHEMGHAMGLQDEYLDPNYPAHALGETGATVPGGCGSTMGTQSMAAQGKCEDLHRRHFMEILRPEKLECGTTGSGPADRAGI